LDDEEPYVIPQIGYMIFDDTHQKRQGLYGGYHPFGLYDGVAFPYSRPME
jgi:hypothetical protein